MHRPVKKREEVFCLGGTVAVQVTELGNAKKKFHEFDILDTDSAICKKIDWVFINSDSLHFFFRIHFCFWISHLWHLFLFIAFPTVFLNSFNHSNSPSSDLRIKAKMLTEKVINRVLNPLEKVSKNKSLINEVLNFDASNSFLPYVSQSSKITCHSKTRLISYIFTNVISLESLSDHFPQFLIVPNIFFNPLSNKSSIYERDWFILVQENFILILSPLFETK